MQCVNGQASQYLLDIESISSDGDLSDIEIIDLAQDKIKVEIARSGVVTVIQRIVVTLTLKFAREYCPVHHTQCIISGASIDVSGLRTT